jgi:hypothetical protein
VSREEEFRYLVMTLKKEDTDDFDVIFLIEPVKKIELAMYLINFETCLESQISDQLNPKTLIAIKFPKILLKLKEKFLLDNVCVTSRIRTMILFYDCQIHLINLKSGEIVFHKDFTQHDIGLDYFLSPTNLPANVFEKITPIENTNSLIAMSNLNQLVYFEIEQANISNKFMTDLSKDKFESFRLSKNFLCAYTKIKHAIFFYNMDVVQKKKSFEGGFMFQVCLMSANSPLNFYGFSKNNSFFYMIENNRELKFHRIEADLKSTRLLGEMNLYHTAACVTCNEEFLCLSMNDQKFVSFLIADPDNVEQSVKKIKSLPSR